MQIWLPPQKIFLVSGFTYLLRMTLRFCQTDKEKSSKSFSDLLLSLAADGRWIFSFESSGQVGPMMDSTINSCFPFKALCIFLFLLMIIFFIINQCTYNNSNQHSDTCTNRNSKKILQNAHANTPMQPPTINPVNKPIVKYLLLFILLYLP